MKKKGVDGKKATQRWELVNPEGVVSVESMPLNPHPRELGGKKILLRWNGKHNGDLFLNRIAEKLSSELAGVQVIKAWEVSPESVVAISGSQERSASLAESLAALKPDIVIGAYGD